VRQTADALRAALASTASFTHVGAGQGRVEQVASNRRLLGPDGKARASRTSATRDAKLRAEPEGLVDPWLKTLSFWDGGRQLAALHYYATHPMSYYGDGRVSSDFCGLARLKRQQDDPKAFQVYFTGCAGNVTAGKYNDGARENRAALRDRVHAGMAAAWEATKRHAVGGWSWRVEAVKLPPRAEASFGAEASRKVLADAAQPAARRGNAAFQLAWLKRLGRPVELTCLDFGTVKVLHLPGEPFVEYQLAAQQRRPGDFVCVAGYGDGGPGYVPTDRAYFEGGYEVTVALAGPSEARLNGAVARLMRAG
jgi:hypothetical protein